ncbi:MAG: hypothetical protein ABI629_07895 [bacterium]
MAKRIPSPPQSGSTLDEPHEGADKDCGSDQAHHCASDYTSVYEVHGRFEPSDARKNHRDINADKPKRPWRRSEKISLATMVVTGLITAAYTGVAFWQLQAMRDTVALTQSTLYYAYGALLDIGRVSELNIVASQSAPFTFTIFNVGQGAAASRVTPINWAHITEGQGPPDFWLPQQFPRPMQITRRAGDEWIYDATVPATDFTFDNLRRIMAQEETLWIYGVVLYFDGVCRRCVPYCFEFLPPTASRPPGIKGNVAECERGPKCSRYGDFSGCPQSDISDRLGYYPACTDNYIPTED